MTRLTRNQRRRAVLLRDEMAKAFPRCFMPRGGTEKKPLKRGIERDLADAMPGWSGDDVWIALADYTSGATYFRCLVEGAARIGLDGEPCGEAVSAEAAKQARAMLLTRLHRPLITDLVTALEKARPFLEIGLGALAYGHAAEGADGKPDLRTLTGKPLEAAQRWLDAIETTDAALSQVRELLR